MFDANKFPALTQYLPKTEVYNRRIEACSMICDMNLEKLHTMLVDLKKSANKNKDLYHHKDTFIGSPTMQNWNGIMLSFKAAEDCIDALKERSPQHVACYPAEALTGSDLGFYAARKIADLYCMFSEEAIETRKQWVEEWQENFSSKYKKAIEYLTSVTRWGNSISYSFGKKKELLESGAVPLLAEYKRELISNYKIAEGYFATPKYKLGDLVELRSAYSNAFHLKIFDLEGYGVPWRVQSKLKQMQTSRRGFLTIIEVDPQVPLGYRKGNKLYKVIAAGETQPFLVEESLIKKIRGIKKKKKGGK